MCTLWGISVKRPRLFVLGRCGVLARNPRREPNRCVPCGISTTCIVGAYQAIVLKGACGTRNAMARLHSASVLYAVIETRNASKRQGAPAVIGVPIRTYEDMYVCVSAVKRASFHCRMFWPCVL